MKQLFTIFLIAFAFPLWAQTDTTVYKFVDESPRFPGCEMLDTTVDVKNQCAQKALLYFFNQNIRYPFEASEQNIEGTVTLSFIVEIDGLVSNITVLKDIGGGCGDEAKRVASAMNDALKEAKLQWTPGKKGGKPVRTQIAVPIKFKLEEPADFVIVNNRDTVFIEVDDSLAYKGGDLALSAYFENNLKFPERYKDSCVVGSMDMTLLAAPDGSVKVIDLSDYCNLGHEFRWEAIKTATATWGKWTPATRKGRQVPSSAEITVTFRPDAAKCAQAISNYEKAADIAAEGTRLFNEGKQEEGAAKLTEALAMFPNNANFLYMRGQAFMNLKRLDEACEDFKKVRNIVYLGVVEQMIPLICK